MYPVSGWRPIVNAPLGLCRARLESLLGQYLLSEHLRLVPAVRILLGERESDRRPGTHSQIASEDLSSIRVPSGV